MAYHELLSPTCPWGDQDPITQEYLTLSAETGCRGMDGLIPIDWNDVWKNALAALALGPLTIFYDYNYAVKKINEYSGNGKKSTADVRNQAYADLVAGKLTTQSYADVIKMTLEADKIAAQKSGLSQFSNVLKWVAIIMGIGFAGYMVMKFSNLIPTKRG